MVTTNATGVRDAVNPILNSIGTALRLKYYNFTVAGAGSSYDDDVSLTLSGTAWGSGLIIPVGTRGIDAFLMEQGKILQDDSKFYILGNLQTSGIIKLGIGSPPVREYSLIDPGTIGRKFGDTNIYKVVYGRFLTNGSMLGE